MKIVTAFLLAVLSYSACSEPDVYQWCQAQIDGTKHLSSLPLDALTLLQKKVSYASSIEELSIATGKNLDKFVSSVQEHQKISKIEAEVRALKLLKQIEMTLISQAFKMHGISSCNGSLS